MKDCGARVVVAQSDRMSCVRGTGQCVSRGWWGGLVVVMAHATSVSPIVDFPHLAGLREETLTL